MTDGPTHYREAERLIEVSIAQYEAVLAAFEAKDITESEAMAINANVATAATLAQVHATLALAAATAQNIRRNGAVEAGMADGWSSAIGVSE